MRAAVVRGKGSYARRGAGGLHPKQGRRGLRADTTPQTNAKVGETAPDFALHSSTGPPAMEHAMAIGLTSLAVLTALAIDAIRKCHHCQPARRD